MIRRDFLSCSAAFAAFQATEVVAHTTIPFVLPDDFHPTFLKIDAGLEPGEIHVIPGIFRLYLTLPEGLAIRYAVGVGRPGLYHEGSFTVGAKREWPRWQPTNAMIKRNPEAYARFADGVPGGVNNPLGARALYLFDDKGHDTYLRIHGTNLPSTIGTAVSNGCARLTNDHVIDLYDRVAMGTRVHLYAQTT